MMKKLLLSAAFIAATLSSIAQWIPQTSGFDAASRGIKYMNAVDENVVWATAYDGSGGEAVIQEFTRTTNGGDLWEMGTINDASGLECAMICAVSADKAWVPMYKDSGSNPQGIYYTEDGGATWTRQGDADMFNLSGSFPNVVHFFNENDGFAQGDPVNNIWELYTTNNGGTTWTKVPDANMPAPNSGEWGVVGYYDAVGDNIWFGTNKGRVFRSADKGLNWDASQTPLPTYTDVVFRDAMHGLAQDKGQNSTGTLVETSDGGATWSEFSHTGNAYTNDIDYVPGTPDTYVTSGADATNEFAGMSYSHDGGHTWVNFEETEGTQFLATSWIDVSTAWAGGFIGEDLTGGMYVFNGTLTPPNPPSASFEDDFEAGIDKWTVDGNWGIDAEYSNSPSHSLADSPGGNYADNVTSYATMTNGVDLTGADIKSAKVNFMAIYDIETGFDYCYVEASDDNFNNVTTLYTFNGEGNLTPWTEYTFSISNFIGSDNVKVRFHWVSDGGYNVKGIYIDDFKIITSDIDDAAPLIAYTAPEFYEGVEGDFDVIADLIDISGISTAQLKYTVEGGSEETINGVNTAGTDEYTFTIPQQNAGKLIAYNITAIDNSPAQNAITTATYEVISGNYIKYDNGVVDFYSEIGPGTGEVYTGAAVAISLGNDPTQLTTALIRTYADATNGLSDDMLVHVWGSGSSGPGEDLIEPFIVTPAATFENTSPMTIVDLRPYSAQLKDLTGDIYIGFTVPEGIVRITMTSPGSFGRSFIFDGTEWAISSSESGENDYHFRAITGDGGVGINNTNEISNTIAVYPNPANESVNVISANSTIETVSIFNTVGQMVYSKEMNSHNLKLNISNYQTGIYFVRIKTTEGIITKKLSVK